MSAVKLGLGNADFATLAGPFVAREVLSLADVHTVDLLARRLGQADPEVLLGLAFAVRAPRLGHVGVDLTSLKARTEQALDAAEGPEHGEARAPDDVPRPGDESPPALDWPVDPLDWTERLLACPLVGRAGDGEPEPHPFVFEQGLLTTWRYHRYQQRLRDQLLRRAAGPEPGIAGLPLDPASLTGPIRKLFPPDEAHPEGTLHPQRLAAWLAALLPLTVISGGPGTGKTYTVKLILALLHDEWLARTGQPPRVALAAPTGKAAVRMVQAISEGLDQHQAITPTARDWLRSLPASTLHRLLGFQPQNTTRFRHGTELRLPHDIVIVDEASMVDLALMCKLVEAVRDDARLLLLGDRHQLASVEAGSVLADVTAGAGPHGMRFSPALTARLRALDEAGLPPAAPAAPALADCIVHYHRPFRFEAHSGVGRLAYAIADAENAESAGADATPLLAKAVALLRREPVAELGGPYDDLRLLPPGQNGRLDAAALGVIVAGYQAYLDRLLAGPRWGERSEAFHADVLRLFEGFRVLTAHRRGRLGVSGLNAAVIEALAKPDPRTTGTPAGPYLRTAGDWWVGRPVLVTENSYDVGRMNGDVGVVVRAGGRLAVAFGGDQAGAVDYLDPARMPPHQTVFAMTIHKSQGSQFDHSCVVLPDSPSPLLTRELVYTAVTRARRRVTVIGREQVLRAGLALRVQRASGLRGMIWGAR